MILPVKWAFDVIVYDNRVIVYDNMDNMNEGEVHGPKDQAENTGGCR